MLSCTTLYVAEKKTPNSTEHRPKFGETEYRTSARLFFATHLLGKFVNVTVTD